MSTTTFNFVAFAPTTKSTPVRLTDKGITFSREALTELGLGNITGINLFFDKDTNTIAFQPGNQIPLAVRGRGAKDTGPLTAIVKHFYTAYGLNLGEQTGSIKKDGDFYTIVLDPKVQPTVEPVAPADSTTAA